MMDALVDLGGAWCEQGGDWDRRNRLKVYEATFLLVNRNLKKAAELFLECIATFTCVELTSYKQVSQ